MGLTMEYENYRLCSELRPKETCVVLEQYVLGEFERRFHMHVPKTRLSQESKSGLLRSLVMRFYGNEGMGAEHIVTLHLNSRGIHAQLPYNGTHLIRNRGFCECVAARIQGHGLTK